MAVHGSNSRLVGSIQQQNNATPIYGRTSTQHHNNPTHYHNFGTNTQFAAHLYNPPTIPQYFFPQQFATPYWSGASQGQADAMMYRNNRPHSKRKSAVELLAETKPFYIKSDGVQDRLSLSQVNYRSNTFHSATNNSCYKLESKEEAGKYAVYSGDMGQPLPIANSHRERKFVSASQLPHGNKSMHPHPHPHPQPHPHAHPHPHHHHHHSHHMHSRHNNPGTSMSNKLRMMYRNSEPAPLRCTLNKRESELKHMNFALQSDCDRNPPQGHRPLTAMPYRNDGEDSILNVSLPPTLSSLENVYNFSVENSSDEEPLVLTENYRPISPPAEYAAETINTGSTDQRSRYQRSYSHSQDVDVAKYATATYNINSHKSLPDLHSHISRHSPHSEILSCCSRGTSINRDSGGSSGHYTHRSEPCYRQRENDHAYMDLRRDSGSSTQHSEYISPPPYPSHSAENAECHCKNPIRFESGNHFVNFTTPEVPKAFQDDYASPAPTLPKYALPHHANHHGNASQNTKNIYYQTPIMQPSGSPPIDDISPPPIQFKRQRCIRFKNRNRVQLPGTSFQEGVVNDTVDFYQKREHQSFVFPKYLPTDCSKVREIASSENITPGHGRETEHLLQLETFFDRLGLNEDKFHEIYSLPKRRRSAESDSDDSTVFFSDVSTVDSMRLPDSTETQAQTTQSYRPSEPPSIVERNARIIKWLCNCKKLQYA